MGICPNKVSEELLAYVEEQIAKATDEEILGNLKKQRKELRRLVNHTGGSNSVDITYKAPATVPSDGMKDTVEATQESTTKAGPSALRMEQYAKYAEDVIAAIQNTKGTVTISKDLAMAVAYMRAYMKGSTAGVANATGNVIKYADFDGLLASEGALKNIASTAGASVDEVKAKVAEAVKGFNSEFVKVHEHIHVATVEFMEKNPDDSRTKYINTLYDRVMKYASANPENAINRDDYWKTNAKEFVAEALSNPMMMEFLNSVDVSTAKLQPGKPSLLEALYEKVLSMLNIKSGSMLDNLMKVTLDMTADVKDTVEDVLKNNKNIADVYAEIEEEYRC